MKKKFYITTPIYYINDVPHVGHAYTTIAADVLSRYYQSKGEDVFFLTGVDEHGAKIAQAAKKAGLEPKEFADSLVPRFQEAWKNLNINYSEFFRTTNPIHEKIVQDLILELKDKGFVEKKKYSGLYCTACEKFLLPDELVDGCCSDHGTKPEQHSEENYFFLLSKFGDKLTKAIEAKDYEILPESRKNEVLGKIKNGLEDVSISREKVEWGIPFPGDENQTIYVWIDALINYFSEETIYHVKSEKLKAKSSGEHSVLGLSEYELFPPDIQLMAKDILWFHAIIWPAMLMALELPLPKKVFVHGFFTVGGEKMSKTRGNVLDPNKLVEKFGADAVRYALLREFPFGEDGDISEEKVALRYQNDLANGLGNLLNRTLSMINKYDIKQKIIDLEIEDYFEQKWDISSDPAITTSEHFANYIKELNFSEYLSDIWLFFIKIANEDIEKSKPWILAKNGENEKLFQVLGRCHRTLSRINILIAPFMPETAEKMKKQLETLEPEALFPRIELDK